MSNSENQMFIDLLLEKKAKYEETNPLMKFVVLISMSIVVLTLTDLRILYLIILLSLVYYRLGNFPYNVAKPKIKMLVTFSMTILFVQVIFIQEGEILFYLLPKTSFSDPFIPIYSKGVYTGLLLTGRFWGVISMSWIFVNTTNPFVFARSITKIKVPYMIAYALSLSLRFAPIFAIETSNIQKAQNARGLNTRASSLQGLVNILKFTLVPLLVSALNRIRGITISMDGRAFGLYSERSYLEDLRLKYSDLVKFFLFILLIIFLVSFQIRENIFVNFL
ncbi:MAG: energy-coupling factor transporter transmembrane component T family protein [Candidatus Hodarchaeales archaeon]